MKSRFYLSHAAILLFTVVIFLAGAANAQTNPAFILTVGGKSLGSAQIVAALDGGFYFVMMEQDSDYASGDRDVIVVKADSLYNIQWANRYYTSTHETVVYGALLMPDGRLCINTLPFSTGIVLLMIDSTGAISSQKKYSNLFLTFGHPDSPDGFNLLSGKDTVLYIMASGTSTNANRVSLLKIGQSGSVLKRRGFNFPNASFYKVKAISDGGVAILGPSYDSLGQGLQLIKVDSSFSTQWWITLNYIDPDKDLFVFDFFEDSSGNLLVYAVLFGSSFGDRSACLIKIGPNGNLLWSKKTSNNFSVAWSPILFEEDGSYYFLYQAQENNITYNFVVSLDTAGNYLGTTRYKDPVNYHWSFSFTSAQGRKILSGYYYIGGLLQQHCFVMNADSILKTSCYGDWSVYHDTIADLPLFARNYPDTVFYNGNPSITSPATFQVQTINIMKTDLCDITGYTQDPDASPFTIYPNPFTDRFLIEFDSGIESGDVVIYNTVGQKILEDRNIQEKTKEFSLPGMPSGFYFVTVYADGNVFTKKIVLYK